MKIRERAVNFIAKNLLKAVIQSDVLTQDEKTGLILIGGKAITNEEARALHQEAQLIRNTRLWGILTTSLRDQAEKTMYQRSHSWDDMVSGKMLLWAVSIQENTLRCLDTYKERERQRSGTINKKDINNS